ncbi:hypothetical protein SAMN02745866_00991 [Alteromonadaceae bacterium Bs31]|nr:hypothetical protein SAMN02745866_00991 [Alteromonadaceae bacterium Bs31]
MQLIISSLALRALFTLLMLQAPFLVAKEKIIALPLVDGGHLRQPYDIALLLGALSATEKEYGPYQFELPGHTMVSDRTLLELGTGKNLSVAVSTYKKTWEGKTLVVPFPIRRGLGSYRFFFANSKNRHKFAQVHTLEQLKSFTFGQGLSWSTTKILNDHGLRVVTENSYGGLFKMLQAGRFDLFMRGADEIVREQRTIASTHNKLYIEDRVVVFTYLPMYYNVTPTRPKLAERIEAGLIAMHESGSFDRLFLQYHADEIALARGSKSNIITLKNTNLPKHLYERDKPYLMDFSESVP